MKIKQLIWQTGGITGLDWLKPENDSNTNAGIERSSFGCLTKGTNKLQQELWFEIRRKGKKNPKYLLFSYPIMNPNFTRANNSKNLGEFDTPEAAAEKAQDIFNEFVLTLIQE